MTTHWFGNEQGGFCHTWHLEKWGESKFVLTTFWDKLCILFKIWQKTHSIPMSFGGTKMDFPIFSNQVSVQWFLENLLEGRRALGPHIHFIEGFKESFISLNLNNCNEVKFQIKEIKIYLFWRWTWPRSGSRAYVPSSRRIKVHVVRLQGNF